jgi:hypothetical protein
VTPTWIVPYTLTQWNDPHSTKGNSMTVLMNIEVRKTDEGYEAVVVKEGLIEGYHVRKSLAHVLLAISLQIMDNEEPYEE